jgi:hypothetical protein
MKDRSNPSKCDGRLDFATGTRGQIGSYRANANEPPPEYCPVTLRPQLLPGR